MKNFLPQTGETTWASFMVANIFAELLVTLHAQSPEIQEAALKMARIISDPQSTRDDKFGATATLVDILFPISNEPVDWL